MSSAPGACQLYARVSWGLWCGSCLWSLVQCSEICSVVRGTPPSISKPQQLPSALPFTSQCLENKSRYLRKIKESAIIVGRSKLYMNRYSKTVSCSLESSGLVLIRKAIVGLILGNLNRTYKIVIFFWLGKLNTLNLLLVPLLPLLRFLLHRFPLLQLLFVLSLKKKEIQSLKITDVGPLPGITRF